ncbi:MAG: hypothetical protein WCA98_17215 [Candidatus Acidiferrales bacterium]
MRCEGAPVVAAEIHPPPEFEIRDQRHHSAESLDTLRALLAGGVSLHADPKRPHFYELEGPTHVFYIYVSPVDGGVELLATWPRTQRTDAPRRFQQIA